MNSLAKAFGGAGYAVPQQQAIGGAAPDAGAIVAEISRELERLGMGGDIDKALTSLDSAKGLNEAHVQQYNALPDQEKAVFWQSLTGGAPQMPQGAPQPMGRMESPYGAGNLGAPVGAVQMDSEAEYPRGYPTPGPGMQQTDDMSDPMGMKGFHAPGPIQNYGPSRGGRPIQSQGGAYAAPADMQSPDEPFDPNMMPGMGEDPRGMFGQEDAFNIPNPQGNSFIPGAEYQTADLAGIDLTDGKGKPNTTSGPANDAAKAAFAYRGLLANIAEYEKLLEKNGARILPGPELERQNSAHTGIMMQMKDIFEMGAPQEAELKLLEKTVYNAGRLGPNLRESILGSDIAGEAKANLDQLKILARNLVEPKLKAANIDIRALEPVVESDEDFLRSLGLE